MLWDIAVFTEREGHEQLIRGQSNAAIQLYIKGIENKQKLLPSFVDTKKLERKIISLVDSCFHLAAVCYSMGQYVTSEKYLYLIIETVQQSMGKGITTKKFAPILQKAYTKLAKVSPWVITFGNINTAFEYSYQ